MLVFIDILEEPPTPLGQVCFLCEAGPDDSHWSTCPFGTGSADTDPDADESERCAEIS